MFAACVFCFACSLTEGTSKGSQFAIKEGTTQKHTISVKQIHRQPAADRKDYSQKRLKNKGFDFFVLHFSIRKIFLWKNKWFFHFFAFFCIFAQGFSLKMQHVEQKTWFWTCFITFLEPKTLKTLILDRFLSENTIKQMLLQHFAFLEN